MIESSGSRQTISTIFRQFLTAAIAWHRNCIAHYEKGVRSSLGVGGPDSTQISNDTPRPTTRTIASDEFMVNRVVSMAAVHAAHRLATGQAVLHAWFLMLAPSSLFRRLEAGTSSFMDAPMAWVGNPPSSPRPGHPGPVVRNGKLPTRAVPARPAGYDQLVYSSIRREP
jgi:hypothetical protein